MSPPDNHVPGIRPLLFLPHRWRATNASAEGKGSVGEPAGLTCVAREPPRRLPFLPFSISASLSPLPRAT